MRRFRTLSFGIFIVLASFACSQEYHSRVRMVNSPDENWTNQGSRFNSATEIAGAVGSALNIYPASLYETYRLYSSNYLIVLEHSRGVSFGFVNTAPVMEHKIGTAKIDKDTVDTWKFTTVAWPANSFVMEFNSELSAIRFPSSKFRKTDGTVTSAYEENRAGYFEDYYELKSFTLIPVEELLPSSSDLLKDMSSSMSSLATTKSDMVLKGHRAYLESQK